MRQIILFLTLALCFSASESLLAQRQGKRTKAEVPKPGLAAVDSALVDTSLFGMMSWRNLGPFRGGRASAVTGVPGQPNLFYMGTAGGGVWRTEDGGRHWNPISDGYFGGTVGGLAVAPSDPNVIYAGGGEQTLRGNVSYGYGVWRSVDAGKTWRSLGLDSSRHIGRVRVHPTDPNLVYVAVMGDLYAPSTQRGVYRSKDGGENWERVLFANADAGAVDLAFDGHNPRILYASTWRARRTPHGFSSGGDGSDLWRSTDAGDTWEKLTGGKIGLPEGTLGIIGVAPSPAKRDRVWAIVEAEAGGVFRSDDGGETWEKTNEDRELRQRAWYYSRIYAHPTDAEQVYVLNVAYGHSRDGGKTFAMGMSPHSDHHDLWINPDQPRILAMADDGGAQISTDRGENWTTYHNQPTAQFYRVTTDNAVPYRIYAAQQDNSTVRIRHRAGGSSIGERDWEATAGCECGHLAPKPDDPEIVYGGCYDGFLERVDHGTQLRRVVSVYPDNPMGHGAIDPKYRFQWNFPLFFSPHDPDKLYAASQYLHVTTNGGQTWTDVSPDLTRDDSTKLGSSGGPITQDNTSVEYYCTIFAAGESPRVEGVLWTGSDDGLVHVSRDTGTTWEDVTPPALPEWTMVNSLDVDPHNDGGCYIAATSYKHGDYTPYLFHTSDYGATWRRIDAGIPRDHFTRVVRVDRTTPELVYAGTESGVYVSYDGATSWQPLQLDLPVVPITDIALKEDDLIVATQGRSLWMLDDVSPLRTLTETGRQTYRSERGQPGVPLSGPVLFPVDTAYLMEGSQSADAAASAEGTNHPGGVTLRYYLPDTIGEKDTVRLVFADTAGSPLRTFSTHPDERAGEESFTPHRGSNRFTWNARGEDAKDFEGMILWWADMGGPRVPPGEYRASLELGDGTVETVPLYLAADPRVPDAERQLAERYAFHRSVVSKVSEAHEAIVEMRALREQVGGYVAKVDTNDASKAPLVELGERMDTTITRVEEALYQTQNRSGQDPLNFPIRLTNKLASLNSMTQGEYEPTDAAYAVQEDIVAKIDAELAIYYELRDSGVAEFNRLVRELGVDAIVLDSK